jgi:DNA repair exonuclease SbcCD nuclease subunit
MSNNNLFKKVAVCTDIHFGNKSNSTTHNQDCEDFIDWFIETAHKNDCETCMFLGDWHHQRASINVHTLNYSLRSLEKLGKSFEKFYFITGNHDLYYRDRRDLNSVEFASRFPGISIVNQTINEGNVAIVPWLVGDDFKKIKKIKAKYIFGHFELPHFYMNAMVQMPDHGELYADDMGHADYVFSGHFHKRQQQKNVIYIGNCFPHNYADAWDDERGMMMLEWDGEPEYVAWPDAPSYKTLRLSQLLENPTQYLDSKTYARVTMDIDISYEEANFIKETFTKEQSVRELSLLPNKEKQDLDIIDEDIQLNFDSIDSIVSDQLANIESEHYNPQTLLEIYRNI